MTNLTAHVYIPSRGRPGTKLPSVLAADGIAHSLVVEPQEADAYQRAHPDTTLLVLPASDQGIAYSRQHILATARARGQPWYWQIDDDITQYLRVQNRRCLPCPPSEALAYAEALASQIAHVALLGFELRGYAWASTRAYTLNRLATGCVLTRTDTGIDYETRLRLKEDGDFLMQHRAAGWRTVQIAAYAIGTQTMGTSKEGGLAPLYQQREDEHYARILKERWPDYYRLTVSPINGHLMCKPLWRVIDSDTTRRGPRTSPLLEGQP